MTILLSFLLSVLASFSIIRAQTLSIEDQRTEGIINPISIDERQPRFSWSFQTTNTSNTVTTATALVTRPSLYLYPYQYRITLASNTSSLINNLQLLWDTGIVLLTNQSSSAPHTVVYNGTYALQSANDYVWRVDANVCTTPVSPSLASCRWINGTIVGFGMGLISTTDWHNAMWLNGYNQMRTSFTIDNTTLATLTRARLYITGVGLYTVYMNGQSMNREQPLTSSSSSMTNPLLGNTLPMVLLPGYSTVYSTRLLYNAFDITSYLQQNTNVIGVRIGSGKYGYLTEYCVDGPSICNGIIALVLIESIDSEAVIHTTWLPTNSSTWYGSVSPIIYENLYIGEIYNATLDQPNWNNPGPFNTSLWSSVNIMQTPPTGTLNTHTSPSVSILNTTSPLLLQPVNSSTWFIDTGINSAGYFSFTIVGPVQPNVTIRIALAERTKVLPDTNATVIMNVFPCPSPCCPKGGGCSSMIYEYVTKLSTDSQTYTPSFSTGGYRFALLSVVSNGDTIPAWPGSRLPELNDFQRHTLTSAIESGGNLSFPSSFPEGSFLERIHTMVRLSQISNAVSHFSDCPHRERRNWGGDSSVTVSEAAINFRLQSFLENTVRTQRDTQYLGCGNLTTGNTCGVFHTSPTNPFVIDDKNYLPVSNTSRLALDRHSFGNGPNERPDCYLCCPVERSEGGDFGCAYFNSFVSGSLPDIIPVNGPSRSWPGSLTWTSVAVTVPDALLRNYGDTFGVENSFTTVWSLLNFYSTVASQNSSILLPFEFYGDWISLEPTTKLYYANAYYAYTTYLGSVMASSIGNSTAAASLLALSSLVNNQLATVYLNTTSNQWDTGSQAALSSALWMNLGGNEGMKVQTAVLANLVHNVATVHNYTVTVGTIGSRTILQALTEYGASDTALSLATQTNYPSWGYFLTTNNSGGVAPYAGQSVGTLWEEWAGMGSSLNHIMLGGGIGEWVWESALGMRLRYTAASTDTTTDVARGYACLAELDGINGDPIGKDGILSFEVCAASYAVQRLKQEYTPTERYTLPVSYLSLVRNYVNEYYSLHRSEVSPSSVPRSMLPRVSVVLEHAFLERIGKAQGTRYTPSGMVSLAWEYVRNDRYFRADISLPSLVPGSVSIPNRFMMVSGGNNGSVTLRITSTVYGSVRTFTINKLTYSIDEITSTVIADPCLSAVTYAWLNRDEVYQRQRPTGTNVSESQSIDGFLYLGLPLGLDYRIELL